LQQQYIPELKMCYGAACSALTKSWKAFRIARQNDTGESRYYAWVINSLQAGLGLEPSQFEELAEMNDDNEDQGLTTDEIQSPLTRQLKREEEHEENGGEWNINYGTSEEKTEEWSEEAQQLLSEEIEAEKENDDW
jgi:hypothetical protein